MAKSAKVVHQVPTDTQINAQQTTKPMDNKIYIQTLHVYVAVVCMEVFVEIQQTW